MEGFGIALWDASSAERVYLYHYLYTINNYPLICRFTVVVGFEAAL